VRILIATPYYVPAFAFGGPVRLSETLVADLLAAGHSVTVATTDVLDENARVADGAAAEPPGVEVVRFRNVSNRLGARAMAWTPRGYRRWVEQNVARFDVVHLHDVYSVISVAAARAAVRHSVPFALQPFGSLAPAPERGKPLLKRAFLRLWGRKTIRTAAALVYSTDSERADFLAEGAPAGSLVRMGLPLDLPRPSDAPRGGDPTVVYVGRLDPIKGIDRLLRAVDIARRSVPGVRLELIGPGDRHRASLERLASELGVAESVAFRGFVSEPEKVEILERAHVFSLLSKSEGLPLAALEAMACGAPAVLSRGCHLPEIHDEAGLEVSGEPEETAAALVALLTDDARRERLGLGARRFAERFRREHVMPEMIAMFERLARERR
jgi:glycosyltransferase involved in cell wall biosynthesis